MLDRPLRLLAAALLLLAPTAAADDARVSECVAASDAPVALATTTDGHVALLDSASGKPKARALLDAPIVGAAISPRGDRVALIDAIGVVHQAGASLESFTRSEALRAPAAPLRGERLGVTMAFAPDSSALLIDIGPVGAVVLGADGAIISAFETRRGGWASSRACWSADGRSIHAITEDGLRIFDPRTGEPRGEALAADGRILDFDLHPTEPLVVTSHRSGAILEWSLETRRIVREWHHEDPQGFDGDQYVNCVAYDPQGDRIAFTTGSGVFLGVVGRESDQPPWYSWYCDGRAGTPAPLAWDPQGVSLWWAFAGTFGELHRYSTDGEQRKSRPAPKGATPTFDGAGHGVTISGGGAVCFDAATHELLWTVRAPDLVEEAPSSAKGDGERGK